MAKFVNITELLVSENEKGHGNGVRFYPISNASNCCSSEGPLDLVKLGKARSLHYNSPVVIFFDGLVSIYRVSLRR